MRCCARPRRPGQEQDDAARAALLAGLQSHLRRINEMMHNGVAELRGFVSRLRADGERAGSFEGIVASYARRFAELTGIAVRVEIEATSELDANDRLCAEIFQMITEGLSNVRRHSEGKLAIVRVSQSEQVLQVSIQNDDTPGTPDGALLAALDRGSRPLVAGLGEGRAACRGRMHRDRGNPACDDGRGAIGQAQCDRHPARRRSPAGSRRRPDAGRVSGGHGAARRECRPRWHARGGPFAAAGSRPARPRSRRRQRTRSAP